MSKTARDIMTRNVIIVDENTAINDLIEIFLEHKISCVPVVNKEKKLVGIVTKTDVLSHLLDIDLDVSLKVHLKDIVESIPEHGDIDISTETDLNAVNIMTPNPITASENTSIESLAKIMIDHNIHRLIIEKDSAIVGIISTLDILYHVAGVNKNG
ncbi:MAG: CBS domain-containing protein [Candidatus Latescibacteria bacterium]|jgi:CBS domain-containing protein|nr:CBS domain-containing protein [Candidatus Latescibacterota bacterium]